MTLCERSIETEEHMDFDNFSEEIEMAVNSQLGRARGLLRMAERKAFEAAECKNQVKKTLLEEEALELYGLAISIGEGTRSIGEKAIIRDSLGFNDTRESA